VVEGSAWWFDGTVVASGKSSGASGNLRISEHEIFKWTINCGPGTNNRAKLLGAWELLTLASRLVISEILVQGGSKIIIDQSRGKGSLQVFTLECWKRRLNDLLNIFHNVTFQHVYRESISEADKLSKQALLKVPGKIEYFQCEGHHEGPHLYLDLY
jgi:hypothetical protein